MSPPVQTSVRHVQIRHFGGAQEVGATSYLLDVGGVRILVDTGGRPQASALGTSPWPDYRDLAAVDAILLTHAHFDHIAALPLALAKCPDVPVYATPQTRDLASLVLADVVHTGSRVAAQQGRRYEGYSAQAAHAAAERILPLPFGHSVRILRGAWGHEVLVEITPIRAGHILGAACFLLRVVEPSGSECRIALLGDISDDAVLTAGGIDRNALVAFAPDCVVSEATYGLAALPPIDEERELLRRRILGHVARGGHLLVPAFAVGRAQEVAALLHLWNASWDTWCARRGRDPLAPVDDNRVWRTLKKEPMLPAVPCHVDGMASAVTAVYERHADALGPVLRATYAHHGEAILSARHQVQVVAPQTSATVGRRPCVIVAPSGMLTGGAITKYLARFGRDPASGVAFSGYVDAESPAAHLGRLGALRERTGRPVRVVVDGTTYAVAGTIASYRLRAHIEGGALLTLLAAVQPRTVLLAHGSPAAITEVAAAVRDRVPSCRVAAPANGELVEVVLGTRTIGDAPVRLRAARIRQDVAGRVLHGATPADVYRVVRFARRSLTAGEIALDLYGVPHSVAEQRATERLVVEVLQSMHRVWFGAQQSYGVVRWYALGATALARGSTIEGPPAGGPAEPVPGLVVVRHLGHAPRLALVGARAPHGRHPAIVAMARTHSVDAGEIMFTLRPFTLPAAAWADGHQWAAQFRRVLTTQQLDAETRLGDARVAIAAAGERALEEAEIPGFRSAWNHWATARLPADAPSGAFAILQLVREAAAVVGAAETTVSRDQLRLASGAVVVAGEDGQPGDDRLLGAVNAARRALGMRPLEAPATEYRFTVAPALAALAALGYAPPGAHVSTLPATPLLPTVDRLAFALHLAQLLPHGVPRSHELARPHWPGAATPRASIPPQVPCHDRPSRGVPGGEYERG